jgi:hypothetical protein
MGDITLDQCGQKHECGILDRQKHIYRGTKFVSPRDIGE